MDAQDFNQLSKEEKKKVPFKQLPTGNKIAVIVVFSTMAILLFTCVGTCSHCSSGNASGIDTTELNAMSQTLAEKAVKTILKAPSTANFVQEDQRIFLIQDSSVVVKGSVDAQNSFGAMLRSSYYVRMKWTSDYNKPENWTILDAHLNE